MPVLPSACPDLWWNPKGVPQERGPPDHEITEAPYPQDAAHESDGVELSICGGGEDAFGERESVCV